MDEIKNIFHKTFAEKMSFFFTLLSSHIISYNFDKISSYFISITFGYKPATQMKVNYIVTSLDLVVRAVLCWNFSVIGELCLFYQACNPYETVTLGCNW